MFKERNNPNPTHGSKLLVEYSRDYHKGAMKYSLLINGKNGSVERLDCLHVTPEALPEDSKLNFFLKGAGITNVLISSSLENQVKRTYVVLITKPQQINAVEFFSLDGREFDPEVYLEVGTKDSVRITLPVSDHDSLIYDPASPFETKNVRNLINTGDTSGIRKLLEAISLVRAAKTILELNNDRANNIINSALI